MGTIQKVELQNNFKDQTGSQITEGTPVNVSNVVSPVWIMNPINNFCKISEKLTSGTTTVMTTSTSKKTYVTSASLGYVKDVACDVASGSISIIATINGLSMQLLRLPVLTLRADQLMTEVSFPPILIDPGTTITIGKTFTAGTMCIVGGVRGYEI